MIPGIDPKVDIAFKRIFGRPDGTDLTISLINAVLQPASGHRVVALELLDPYNDQEALDDKLTILDLKARDEQRRLFNVEMQMNLVPSLAQRVLYYWSQLYSRQLSSGEDFSALRPAVSICFLNQTMFPVQAGFHNVFVLLERQGRLCLTQDLEIHLLELPKFKRTLEALHEPLDFWLFFFQNGQWLDADSLPAPFARPEIREALEVLKMFTQSDVERDRYENRLKALRDQRGFVREHDEALAQRDAVLEKLGQAEEQFTDAEREIKQELLKRIQLFQRLLGHPPTATGALMDQTLDQLRMLARELEQQWPAGEP